MHAFACTVTLHTVGCEIRCSCADGHCPHALQMHGIAVQLLLHWTIRLPAAVINITIRFLKPLAFVCNDTHRNIRRRAISPLAHILRRQVRLHVSVQAQGAFEEHYNCQRECWRGV